MTIDRDAFRREGFADGAAEEVEGLSNSVDEFAARAPEDHDALQYISLADHARTVACRAWVFEPNSHWLKDGLRISMQATTAAYAIWYADESEVELPLGPRTIRFKTGQEPKRGGPGAWIRAASIAAFLRDKKITRRLLTLYPVPDDSIGVREAKWCVKEQAALRRFLEGAEREDVLRRIDIARGLTTPEQIEPWSVPAATDFGLPEMAMLEAIVRRDQKAFRAALTLGVERFQSHYASEPLTLDSVLAIELIGLSAIAIDRALPADVDADELPDALVDDTYVVKS